MTRTILISFLCFAALTVAAQETSKKIFPEAEAVYTRLSCEITIGQDEGKLSAVRNMSEDLVYQTENSVRMMNRGYIFHSGFNQLQKWDAFTQLPDGKKKLKTSNVNTTSSRQSYVFYDDTKSTSFDYSGGMVGATRHLEYQLLNKDVSLLTPFYFERYFPVAEAMLSISFPDEVKLKYIKKGLNAGRIVFSETHKKGRTTYTFQVKDLEGVRSYEDAPDNAWYATHLIFYIEQVKENGTWKNFLAGADDLFKHNYSYIRQLNNEISPELKGITDSLIRSATGEMDKAKRIYRWVQMHIKYVAFEEGMEGFVPRAASLVCSRRFGDCKDMASILTTMLNYAGVHAYFTWIGTRDIPYDYSEVPLPLADNHMICTIRVGENDIFLDGTDNGCIFGMPSEAIQGKQAMVAISENEFKLIRVPVIPKEKNTIVDSTFLELSDKGITGRIRVSLKGYYASNLYGTLSYRNETERNDYFKNRFERGSNKIRFSNWKLTEMPDRDEMIITADFELPDYAKKLGDEWFLNLNLFKWYEHQEIDFPKRKIPIGYSFLEKSTYVTAIKIPAGYKAGYIPKSETFKNDVWGFVMNYATVKDQVYLTQEFDTDHMLLTPDQFESWNKVLEHLFPQYKQTISFQKN
jgi:hypothetical protein